MIGQERVGHYCCENDNHFDMVLEDGELDELRFGTPLTEEGKTIIDVKDLRAGLARIGYVIEKKEKK